MVPHCKRCPPTSWSSGFEIWRAQGSHAGKFVCGNRPHQHFCLPTGKAGCAQQGYLQFMSTCTLAETGADLLLLMAWQVSSECTSFLSKWSIKISALTTPAGDCFFLRGVELATTTSLRIHRTFGTGWPATRHRPNFQIPFPAIRSAKRALMRSGIRLLALQIALASLLIQDST